MSFSAVPVEAQPGLEEVLARAISVEVSRFTDESAAEPLLWTLFSHLLQAETAAPVWRLFSGESAPWPAALFWGGEALGEQAEVVREQLLEKSPGWAPDLILEHWPAGLVIVMARYLRPPPRLADSGWLDEKAFADPASLRASGRFDLARAWKLGWELAGRRRFTLVELRPFAERVHERVTIDLFRSSLVEREDRRFVQLTFGAVLNALPRPWPEWLAQYVAARRL
jgi:hypothetical protein